VNQCTVIISIVPPRDAIATAQRISDALLSASRSTPLLYLDLNAISPFTARKIAIIFARHDANRLHYMDGGIIGPPPKITSQPGQPEEWYLPAVPVSGPHKIPAQFAQDLDLDIIGPEIGKATGLKNCFASLSKGLTALAIQSFATAESLGVLHELQVLLKERNPAVGAAVEKQLVACPPKAYRWVNEMEQIEETFAGIGGFGGMDDFRGGSLFGQIAGVYRFMAEDTELGKERAGARSLGTTPEGVAKECAKALGRDAGKGMKEM